MPAIHSTASSLRAPRRPLPSSRVPLRFSVTVSHMPTTPDPVLCSPRQQHTHPGSAPGTFLPQTHCPGHV